MASPLKQGLLANHLRNWSWHSQGCEECWAVPCGALDGELAPDEGTQLPVSLHALGEVHHSIHQRLVALQRSTEKLVNQLLAHQLSLWQALMPSAEAREAKPA